MHIYAFGSVCRGEVDASSDIDMLAIVKGCDSRFNPSDYSVYSYERIHDLWKQGNPFAWHLFLESKLVYSQDDIDHLQSIGEPSAYKTGIADCEKFREIFSSAKESMNSSDLTEIFDLSSVFLAVRNFATCYSLHSDICPDFSRNSARNLGIHSISIDASTYSLFERARVLCTRGLGEMLNRAEINKAKNTLDEIDSWMMGIVKTMKSGIDERI
ncbi:Nucleotidyltransferase family protein [Acidithiobacillus ferrivorans]|uniref:Nucleotidyltransferase family protein n=1 Tax=Acidithiobacillus ferrivorans TaxID=160808 RepID=A0A060UNH7_9PROT|nr:nucleotidyltransferase [Acidithiobacillus ferrivorans]CDQ09851.1 Nucleotidyltransferase family protein [Acidithiobacillus ferrivorans]SMH67351.1 Nucleotidyltransferase family protein [Acidithiobacillus ferrivorans]